MRPRRTIPAPIFGLLREAFDSSFVYAVGRGDATFIGATPELLIRREGQRASTVALAGSTRRSADPAVDDHLGEQLLRSDKDREENAIVARRIARDAAPVLGVGDRRARAGGGQGRQHPAPGGADPRAAGRADRRRSSSSAGCTRRRPSAPSRPRALGVIPALEGFDRGWYAGAVGWTDASGDGEFCVALRCALLRGAVARCYAGCGIVARLRPGRRAGRDRDQAPGDAAGAGRLSLQRADRLERPRRPARRCRRQVLGAVGADLDRCRSRRGAARRARELRRGLRRACTAVRRARPPWRSPGRAGWRRAPRTRRVSPLTGRKWKIPPPSLLSSDDRQLQAEPPGGEQPADVVRERDVADQQHHGLVGPRPPPRTRSTPCRRCRWRRGWRAPAALGSRPGSTARRRGSASRRRRTGSPPGAATRPGAGATSGSDSSSPSASASARGRAASASVQAVSQAGSAAGSRWPARRVERRHRVAGVDVGDHRGGVLPGSRRDPARAARRRDSEASQARSGLEVGRSPTRTTSSGRTRSAKPGRAAAGRRWRSRSRRGGRPTAGRRAAASPGARANAAAAWPTAASRSSRPATITPRARRGGPAVDRGGRRGERGGALHPRRGRRRGPAPDPRAAGRRGRAARAAAS